MGHVDLMDKIYRHQRYIYDLTRKHFLLGRDRLIREMPVEPGETVLEMGCGTARNLILLAKRRPEAMLYGLDASHEMLITAEANIQRAGLADRIQVRHCLAEDLSFRETFGVAEPFDRVFFSYSLSMIPVWREALLAALTNLKPGGSIHVVDFWDQHELPGLFRGLLTWWIGLFHVRFEPLLLDRLHALDIAGVGRLRLESHRKSYAYLAHLEKVQDVSGAKSILFAEPTAEGADPSAASAGTASPDAGEPVTTGTAGARPESPAS